MSTGHWTRVLALGVFLLTACGPKPTDDRGGHGVLVIAIDGLRVDHLSCAGYDRPTTRVIDALASQGVLCTNAWSAAPRSLPAHVALLTGADPWIARRELGGPARGTDVLAWRIPDAAPRLAQEFLAHGYATAAFVGSPELSPVTGFSRGFQEFIAPAREDGTTRDTSEYGFDGVSQRFANWLSERSAGEDWFAYLQVDDLVRLWGRSTPDEKWDTFFPPRPELSAIPPVSNAPDAFFAVPRSRWSGGTLSMGEYEARYDGALRALDDKLGQLLERLRRGRRLRATTVVITGAFGLSFGESGLYLSSGMLSDAELRVPLVVRPSLDFELERGRKSSELISTLDVAPTLLELMSLPRPAGMHGRSLVPVFFSGQTLAERPAVFASGGVFLGWSAIDSNFCFESTDARVRGGDLVTASFTGERRASAGVQREFLHDHARGLSHLGTGAHDDAARARLETAGREWFGWMERARTLLQAPPERVDPREFEILRGKDYVGDLR
jgi:arylsulfatase A-like enzyme